MKKDINIIRGYKGLARLFYELSGRHITTKTAQRMTKKWKLPLNRINYNHIEFNLGAILKTEFTKHAYKKRYRSDRNKIDFNNATAEKR